MRAFVLVVLLFIIQISLQQDGRCSSTTYGNIGAGCDDARNSTRTCKQFLSCVKGSCQPSYSGSNCQVDGDCFLSRRTNGDVKCISGKCAKMKYNGELCSLNEHCYGKRCSGGRCFGDAEGTVCDPNNLVSCAKGLYCSADSGKCAKQIQLAENCDDFIQWNTPGYNWNVICPGGSRCSRANGGDARCRKYGYVLENEGCDYDTDCAGFMFCNGQQACEQPKFGELCTGAAKNCSSLEGEQCICGSAGNAPTCLKTSQGRNACNYPTAIRDIRNCAEKANCPFDRNYNFFSLYVDVFPTTGSCVSENCGILLRGLVCCFGSGFDNTAYAWSHSAPLACSTQPLVVAVVVILFLIALTSIIATAVIIIVVLVRRKKGESFQPLE